MLNIGDTVKIAYKGEVYKGIIIGYVKSLPPDQFYNRGNSSNHLFGYYACVIESTEDISTNYRLSFPVVDKTGNILFSKDIVISNFCLKKIKNGK